MNDAIQWSIVSIVFLWFAHAWYLTNRLKSVSVQLKSKNEELQLEREKSERAAHFNHELRNPIAALVTSIELLAEQSAQKSAAPVDSESKHELLINSIGITSRHIQELLNDSLELGRLETSVIKINFLAFSVRALLNDVLEINGSMALAAGNKMQMRVQAEVHDMWVGPVLWLRQVLLNLTSNANKHAKHSDVIISVDEQDNAVVFEVSDTGSGMSEHALKHLYQPYASSLGERGTSGLGLLICKHLVEFELAGTIDVKSSEKGTTFRVILPLKKKLDSTTVQSPRPLITTRFDASMAGKKLLIVDDSEHLAQSMAMALEGTGLSVETALSVGQAINIINDGSRFDFVIIDRDLNGGDDNNGIDLTKILVSAGITNVFGFTGNTSSEVETKWLAAGARAVIIKPVSLANLLIALKS